MSQLVKSDGRPAVEPRAVDLVVVGAGPHALAVLAALGDRLPARTVVVDPVPGWAGHWESKLDRLGLLRLRSPQVHHPLPKPMALRDPIEALREAALVPTPAGLRLAIELAGELVGPHERLLSGVTRVTQGEELIRVELSDGGALTAPRVLLAHGWQALRVPEWAQPAIATGRASHARFVDLRTAELAGQRRWIVGGGLTAPTLALGVAQRGGHATLLSRRPLRARPYDVDAGWLGPKQLAAFEAASFPERRRMIDLARDGGTIPPAILDELRARAVSDPGSLTLRGGVDVEAELAAAGLLDAPPSTSTPDTHAGAAAGLWLATG